VTPRRREPAASARSEARGAATLDLHRVAAARLWATHEVPYLASALFACTVREDHGCGTVRIDSSWQVSADPEVLAALSVSELGRLLIHLCGHVLRDHGGRARTLGVEQEDGRALWNRAADAELNDDLHAAGLVPAVAPDRPDDLGCADGWLAERYYAEGSAGPRRWDCGAGADGHERSGDGRGSIDPGQGELLRVATAAEIQRGDRGSVPGGWLRWAESVLPSRTDWRRALAAEVRRGIAVAAGRVDYSFSRPSRRAHLMPDIVAPALVRPVPDVAIVCDTSGSMHERLLERALAEIEAVLTRAGLGAAQVRVLAVDAAVQTVRRVSRARDVALAGGGGTDMGEGIMAAAELRPRPAVVIVLTDGYTPWPLDPPRGVRVIVGLLAEGGRIPEWPTPDWARTIIIDDPA
jgi:predicted metal-dependent peptidase